MPPFELNPSSLFSPPIVLLLGTGLSGGMETEKEQRFHALVEKWREERGPTSSATRMAMTPSYQQIIGMGQDVVPLILEEMRRRPDHWFWALQAITGEDPVRPENRGKVREMAFAWLLWGLRRQRVTVR